MFGTHEPQGFLRALNLVRRGIIYLIIFMIAAFIIYLTLALLVITVALFVTSGSVDLQKADVLVFFGDLLLVVVGLELLESIRILLKESKVHVETVLLVAITVSARELIVYNYDNASGVVLIGIGVVIATLASSYVLIRWVEDWKGRAPEQPNG